MQAQDTLYFEGFDYPDGTTTSEEWVRDISKLNLQSGDYFEVHSNRFEGRDMDGVGIWTSRNINIAGYASVDLSIDLFETGQLEGHDNIYVYYALNNNSPVPFEVNGHIRNDFDSAVASHEGLFGDSVKIIIHADAIKEKLIPGRLSKKQISFVYASETDMLNMALFGKPLPIGGLKTPKQKAICGMMPTLNNW